MKFLILFFLYSCSQVSTKAPSEGMVSGNTALDHIRSSYMKGCVDAYLELKVPRSFESCRDRAIGHMKEVEEIIFQPL